MSRSATPVRERYSGALILKTTTAASGTGWVVLGNANSGGQATFVGDGLNVKMTNLTAVSLSYAFGAVGDTAPTGETYEVPSGCSDTIYGVDNIQAVFVRETSGTSTGAKTFKALAVR